MRSRRTRLVWFAAALLLSSSAHAAQTAQTPDERIAGAIDLFKKEADPVRRARYFPHLGELQLEEMERLADGGDFIHSGKLLEEYRDEVKNTFQGLKATGVDAERKPNGFKELEIHLRKALKQIDETVRKVPEGPRVPFEVARQDVVEVNRELIDLLFPRHPGKASKDRRE